MAVKLSEATSQLLQEELEKASRYEQGSGEPFISQEIINDNGLGVSEKEISDEIGKRIHDEPYMEIEVEDPTIEMAVNNYSNSGYGTNANGEYFNPNTDEYDASYNPSNDQLFNPEPAKSTDELLNEYTQIQNQMGAILNKEAYPGIENENIHDISFQLDENEIDKFIELKNRLDEINSINPSIKDLYINNYNKEQEAKANIENTQEQVVDDNPQHIANPETGYAVGGFQAPSIVTNVNEEAPQENNNVETPITEEAQQPEQRVETPQAEQTEETMKAQRRKELLKKSLVASAGFVTGLGLSCVPGVGTIRMGVAAVKLTGTAVNVWANKHPDGKVAQVRDSAMVFAQTHMPRITNGIKNINNKMKQYPVNVFINGMAAGYITGNIFELITGNTVLEAVQGQFNQVPDAPVVDNTVTQPTLEDPNVNTIPDASTATDIADTAANAFDPAAATEAIKGGATIDLSGISQGLVSSDATSGVNLITQAGKDVSFLREVTLNDGTVMWAFNQSNGMGYAWFKAEDVLNELAKTGQTLTEVAGRSM